MGHIRQLWTSFRNKVSTINTRMFQKLGLLAETESHFDNAEGIEDEDEVSASSVIYSSKNN